MAKSLSDIKEAEERIISYQKELERLYELRSGATNDEEFDLIDDQVIDIEEEIANLEDWLDS